MIVTLRSTRYLVASLGIALSLGVVPAVARADAGEKEACAKSYEAAQRFRKKGQLRASRRELLECARATCPAVLSTDCASWLRDLDAALPTIVPVVRDGEGRDIVDARVSVDGELVASKLEGRALEIDPGQHVLRVVVEGREPLEQTIVVREGERRRAVTVSFPSPRPAASQAAAGASSQGEAPPVVVDAQVGSSGTHPAAWVFGGLGLASLGGFAYFGVTGLNQESTLRECRPHCTESAVSDARRSYLFADVTLGVGVVSLLAATYFFMKRPAAPPTTGSTTAATEAATMWVAPTVLAGGGFHATLGGRFSL